MPVKGVLVAGVTALLACLAQAWPATAAAGAQQALSADGLWRLQSDGTELVLRDAGGTEAKRWVGRGLQGGLASPVLSIVPLTTRRSFVIAFENLAELWELQLDPAAEPIFNGWVHDYRMGEGIAEPGYLGLRRTRLPEPVQALATDRSGAWVLARGSNATDGRAVLYLLQLDLRKAVATFVVDADPALDRAQARPCGNSECIVAPDRRGGAPLVLDVRAARLQDR